MIDEGHVIGNHTVTHPSAGLQSLSVEDQIKEIKDVHDYMLENYNYEMYLFRFPTGAFSEQSLAIVQSLGYRSVFWSFAHRDWVVDDQPDVGESLQKAINQAHGGEIFLCTEYQLPIQRCSETLLTDSGPKALNSVTMQRQIK